MTTATITTDYNKGQFVKADRTKKSSYSVCIKSEKDGKLYWVKPSEIVNVKTNATTMTGEKFCSLLQIAFYEN
jgi:hypothetical protein